MKRHTRTSTVVIFLCFLIIGGSLFCHDVTAKVDRNTPHGHYGKLKPYPPGPFVGLTLTKDDEMTLERGDSVMKQTLPSDGGGSGGTAICIQDVHAPITAVWSQILHMEEYPKKVNKVLKCENYHVQEEEEMKEPAAHQGDDDVSVDVSTTKKGKKPSTTNGKKILRIKTKQVLGVLPGYSVRTKYKSSFQLTWFSCIPYR
jgi:hypothetical protein